MDARNKRKNPKYYSLLLIPHDSGKPLITLKLPQLLVRSLAVFALFSVLVVSGSVFYSTFISGKLIHYNRVVSRNAEQNKKISSFASETTLIRNELQSILDENNKLREMLGLKVNKTKIYEPGKIELFNSEKQSRIKNTKLAMLEEKIEKDLKLSQKEVRDSKKSLDELKARVKHLLNKIASAPSVWPLHGRIVSVYGYRNYPWRGFHSGVDISGAYGTPIRCTAPGVVSFVGWRNGYGKIVEINHSDGLSTLYAHLSKAAIAAGTKVERQQVVGYVGTTGYSTGPHLHYEVRKWGDTINPAGFLNLDIRTASKYL
ncbi:MAG: peptidoglycan DD-metalloendopeptidase family protein [Candidatus Margulisiibacteriota bacterium]|nr:peptidoglycan DD-metalloendopeptidase family protein [Candidatus Margulisiibacteriota bacterium]